MYGLCVTIVPVLVFLTAYTEASTGDGHQCESLHMASMCQGFGYSRTEVSVNSDAGYFIEKVARRLGEKGRVADPALLPFLCYSTVPKCRPGDASRSNLRPCKEACTQLEALIDPAMSEAAGGENKGRICESLELVSKGEGNCVRYNKLKELGEANPEWKRINLPSSHRNN